MGSGFRKFRLLLWKNYTIQMRHKWDFWNIALSLVFSILLVLLRRKIPAEEFSKSSIYPEFDPRDPQGTYAVGGKYILYAPNTPEVERIMNITKHQFGEGAIGDGNGMMMEMSSTNPTTASDMRPTTDTLVKPSPAFPQYEFRGFSDEAGLLKDYMHNKDYFRTQQRTGNSSGGHKNVNPVLAAVVFKTNPSYNEIRYQIRFPARHHGPPKAPKAQWWTNMLYPEFQGWAAREQVNEDVTGPNRKFLERGGAPGYWEQGFLFMQSAIDTAIIHMRANDSNKLPEFRVTLSRYPYPKYRDDKNLGRLISILPVVIWLSYTISVLNIAESITLEAERKLKVSMKIMGLPNWLHWSAWLTKSFIILMIPTTLITILYKLPVGDQQLSVLTYADASLLFVFLVIYAFATITFAFLIASFCPSATVAAMTSQVLFFVSYIPYMTLASRYTELGKGTKLVASLFANSAMGFGCRVILMFEMVGSGIRWSKLTEVASPDDNLTILDVLIMMLMDGFLYLGMAIYIEAVFPGDYGVPLPWYFLFTKRYWFGGPPGPIEADGGSKKVHPENASTTGDVADRFEEEPEGNAGVRIIGLTKVFGQHVAVNDMHLNFYENQVTALLGHNGAGKTVAMSMLTGLFPPTSGTAIVNGSDIRTDIESVQKSLGLCPQHNVLFDELTVEEHLEFFCLLKGYDKSLAKAEVDRMVTALQLQFKRYEPSNKLSGGLKRKLSVGIALIGGSKVVLLDEPTSGMDPGARRATWDLILKEKTGRTIVLSTHFMDEADLLGDRIAIMAHGRVVCCGSSLFLKKRYGGGYHLIMEKQPNCQVNLITQLLQKYIPEVDVDQNIGTELSYSLPDAKVSLFPAVFEELEKRKAELGIASYGCSITQMEEVFIRVGQEIEKEMTQESQNAGHQQSALTIKSKSNLPSNREIHSGISQSQDPSKQEIIVGMSKDSAETLSLSYLASTKDDFQPGQDNQHYHPAQNKGAALLSEQLWAMLVKKCLYLRRNMFLLLVQILVPVFYIGIDLTMLSLQSHNGDLVERTLDLSKYTHFGNPITAMYCPASPPKNICSTFKNVAEIQSMVVNTGNTTFEDYILDKSDQDITQVNSRYIVGLQATSNESGSGSGGKEKLTGFFNNQPFHAAPVALNLVYNSILRNLSEKKELKLTVSNYPLPFTAEDEIETVEEPPVEAYQLSFVFLLAMTLLATTFIFFLIRERESRYKQLQYLSGVKLLIFWVAHFLFDFVNYLFSCIFLVIVPVAFQVGPIRGATAASLFFLILVIHGWAIIPLMYLLSFRYSAPSEGYGDIFSWSLISGMWTLFIMQTLQTEGLTEAVRFLEWIFFLLPNFDLGYAVQQIAVNVNLHTYCPRVPSTCQTHPESVCCKNYPISYFGWNTPGLGKISFYLFVIGLSSLILLFLIESRMLPKMGCCDDGKGGGRRDAHADFVDPDVEAENNKVRNAKLGELFQDDSMVLKDLTKCFGDFVAVDKICLEVNRGSCFGLLGINGAGKTTVFKMLTGDITISAGDAFITGKSVKRSTQNVHGLVGYCPQFEGLLPEMTGRETIRLFARLRGIPESEINDLVDELGRELMLSEHIEKPCGTYSGGNKRKLSTAISLLGSPPVILLDEPTTGLDPVARRHVWNTLLKAQEMGTSIILTSHSMEECEALCNRLAIMVNGKFRCLGSTQHLKNKFGDGYALIAQMKCESEEEPKQTSLEAGRTGSTTDGNGKREEWELRLQPLREFIEKNFPASQLKDMHPCYVHYHIPMNSGFTWGEMFKRMEEAKALFQLEVYSVGQTSLEQIFLGFCKGQYNTN